MREKRTIFTLVLFLLLLSLTTVFGQSRGRIVGTITDQTTGEALFGANVYLEGQSLGAATDIDGQFKIVQIPAGSYTLIVRYIGYEEQKLQVQVDAGKTLELDVALANQVIEGQEITITAQALGQKQAINQQLSANTIKNVVASEKIQELPDDNAATALSRLPGLSLMEGDKVVIRGIQSKNNVVLVNGVQLPSTDLQDRSTNLGFISSNMLSGIEVVKALTPDMDANAIGGVVNLRLREAPEDFHFDVMTQGVYNHQDRTTDNYKFWASVSNRFLDNKLGVFIQGNANRYNGGNDIFSVGYGIGKTDPGYGEAPYNLNTATFADEENITTNYGASVILDYKLPNGKIVLQNTLAHTINDLAQYRMEMNFGTTGLAYALFRDKHQKDLLINALQFDYNFGDVKLELGLSHSYSDKVTDVRYGDPGNNFGFQNQLEGHPFGLDADGNAISYADRVQTLTSDDVLGITIDPTDWQKAVIYGWAITRGEEFKQHLYNSTLDFTIPASLSQDFSAEFKVGGKFTRSTRINDVEESYRRTGEQDFYNGVKNLLPNRILDPENPIMMPDVRNYGYHRGDYYLESEYDFEYALDKDMMDEFMLQARDGWAKSRHKTRSERDDFDGTEIFAAGYAMGTFNVGPRLEIIAGGRYEYYNMKYNANFVYVTHSVDGNGNLYDTLNTVDRDDNNFFPNAQIRYKLTDWMDIRAAYTETISRPDYQAILPNTYFEPGGSAQSGNTSLKPALSTNYDLYLSFYNNEIGLFTIGGFYKKIDDMFYSTEIYYNSIDKYGVTFPDSTTWEALGIGPLGQPAQSRKVSSYINNPSPAYIKGFEVEWQTNFWYLPEPLNSLVLNVNYTRVWSDMDYLQIRNIDSTYQDGRFTRHVYFTKDTVRNARLLFQGNDILNVALGVDYKDFSGRVSFNLQGDVITSVGLRPETDQFIDNVYKVDLTLQQKLPIEGLSIAFNGVNLLHSPTKTFSKFRRTTDGEIIDNLVNKTFSPTRYELNLRYNF